MQVRLALGLAISFGIGALALPVLHAQTKPSVYYIAEGDVTDLDGYVKEFVPKGRDDRGHLWGSYPRRWALHFLGTGVGIMALIIGLITFTPLIAILGIGLGYLLAWSGHLLIEGNRPPCFAIRCGHCCATYACFAFG